MFFTIAIFVIALAVLVLSHEFGHFISAKRSGVRVEEFGFGFPPKIFGFQYGETLYSINLLPLRGFVKIFGEDDGDKGPESFGAKSIKIRSLIISAGVVANILVAFLFFSFVRWLGIPEVVDGNDASGIQEARVEIVEIAENSPAKIAGLARRDVIVGLRDSEIALPVNNIAEIQEFIDTRRGEEVFIEILRGNEALELSLVPRKEPPEGEGAIGISMLTIGFRRTSWYMAPVLGFQDTLRSIAAIFAVLGTLVASLFGFAPLIGDVAGPVGIASIVGEAGRLGLSYFLQIVAFLSVNLAVLNILPVPALDGGRLLFLAIEKIKGAPLPAKIPRIAHSIGFIILIALLLVITYRDIIRLL